MYAMLYKILKVGVCIILCLQHSTCNDFVAGNQLRSANRYKALDETAVFGYACRHEFPGRFINLKHGERYVDSQFLLQYHIEFQLCMCIQLID